MRTCISFDPGTFHTGYCVWIDGKPTECDVIEPPYSAKTYLDRAFSVFGQATALVERVNPDEVAVEDFSHFHVKDDKVGFRSAKTSMMKCAGIQMGLTWIARLRCDRVVLVSKGNTTKKASRLLAKAYGIEHKKDDPIDALQIGVCAGFDRRQR
jgi:Holliday junction resolvasome RuvABC endonuclease subunit